MEYQLIRQKRRTLAITVSTEGVTVKAPPRATLRTIEAFVSKKQAWIARTQAALQQRRALQPRPGFLRHLGSEYRIVIRGPATRNSIELTADELIITSHRPRNQAYNRKLLHDWLNSAIKTIFAAALHRCLARFPDLAPPSLAIRKTRSRWGSYAPGAHRVMLNSALIQVPLECLDYVVIHELCHHYHPNHGPEFYALLSATCPSWSTLKKHLAQAPPHLESL
jgi:predicted metal-dependent hydrolase